MRREATVSAVGLALFSFAGLSHGQLNFTTSTTGMTSPETNGVFGCGSMVYAATQQGV